MIKKILNLQGVSELKKQEKLSINGGSSPFCSFGPLTLDCSTNIDGRCTCVNGRCVKGPEYHCR
ncbi:MULTISPECIES: hypothetical protein [unclassified Aquimarina]|uniref:hypothetical protein n=1 Tax=unclassified Aquimarina TaxID=2627091 RepID=UPI000D55A1F0|nr:MULTISPECIES: hypothetical protein [unclassified Aquimarina]AXT54887.1 hypothetical protein D1815_03640 [Aquimarina sp. AD1]RKN21537.1 hypothetical protein D7035_12800 [Aquimarina sp. AD1]